VAGYLDAFASFRDTVRGLAKAKAAPGELLAACDTLRDDTLPLLGVRLEDRPDGEGLHGEQDEDQEPTRWWGNPALLLPL
jgi:hypothetical protein